MQVYVTLVRRELGSFFVGLTGYVLIAAVLFLLGLSFVHMLTQLNIAPTEAPVTEGFFVTFYFWLILLLTAPVITMRSFSQEKFSGTYETLMTSPVGDLQVVLAKFSGAFIFYLLTWLPLTIYLLVVRHYSSDPGILTMSILASTFLGILLVGAVYIAMGCFASSLTQSQIMAAMISYVLGLALFLLSLWSLYAATPGTGWEAKVLSHISMIDHMAQFARGVVDTRHLIFYLSVAAFFLFLTWKVVESRRWK